MSVLVTRGAGGASGLPGCGAVPSVNAPLIAGTGATFSPAALTFASFPLPSRPGFAGGGTGVITVVEPSGNRRPTCALNVTGLPLTVVYTYSWSNGSTCCGSCFPRAAVTADSASGIGERRRGRKALGQLRRVGHVALDVRGGAAPPPDLASPDARDRLPDRGRGHLGVDRRWRFDPLHRSRCARGSSTPRAPTCPALLPPPPVPRSGAVAPRSTSTAPVSGRSSAPLGRAPSSRPRGPAASSHDRLPFGRPVRRRARAEPRPAEPRPAGPRVRLLRRRRARPTRRRATSG